MVATLPRRELLVLVPLLAAGALVGALAAASPLLGASAAGGLLLIVLPFAFPVGHLTLLIAVTALVPYSIQNTFGLGGGSGSPGLIAADVLLVTGLLRALVVLLRDRLEPVSLAAVGLALVFLGLVAVQFVIGLRNGGDPSTAGDELRKLLGFGVIIVAYPVLLVADQRRRLLSGLVGVGLMLGLWGLVQWRLPAVSADAVDFGVREGVRLTSGGRGQLQGGLFAYPVAIVFGFAFLLWGTIRSGALRVLLMLIVALNTLCVLLTFERTFWLVTILGCLFVLARSTPTARLRALLLVPLVLVLVPVAALFPTTITTAQERLLSIRQYGSDASVSFRVTEYREVADEVAARPWAGSGLGATAYFGWPEAQVRATEQSFSHNGYLWLAWKLGIPGALLLVGGVALAVARRGVGRGDPLMRPACVAAQASLLALSVASITFPAFHARSITPTMGLLLALAAVPVLRARGVVRPARVER